MHPPSAARALGLLVAGVTATLAIWVVATPTATSTVAPAAVGRP